MSAGLVRCPKCKETLISEELPGHRCHDMLTVRGPPVYLDYVFKEEVTLKAGERILVVLGDGTLVILRPKEGKA